MGVLKDILAAAENDRGMDMVAESA